ncbi:SAM-dependent methyltransferase [Frankia sp. CNm7]|uniref:SAM-dependent methyltransferase n=1 Tax=Frankia nepalensis TaxID=1836974 RepID=A0A937RKA4_9ACTN|nr:SAM-dependent methyltransferase [Frankia nepalensis]MBL7501417.1 SAM-dependent methyltransferase [Frankia nepalensis]MBL7510020.1 SAM-dependent methyltransferase [Frankia nepalensis]MBL7517128.1 SAM-dependent methyltransferase [Frankia nepalensis]MBL7627968.1 SAM-dependent methyltransferase [Frankia nepalensis]
MPDSDSHRDALDTALVRAGIDVKVPSIARVYDALLDGKDNFPADRAVHDQLIQVIPDGKTAARYNRQALRRGVEFMVERGIRQFLDLGSGLPTAENTHQVAQRIAPDSKVAYVDIDPIVLAHGRALLAENENTTVVTADFTRPDEVLSNPDVTALIDLSKPVGVLMLAVVHHVHDDEDPAGLVRSYVDRLASGSYMFVTHFVDHGVETKPIEQVLLNELTRGRFRSLDEITSYFGGLELVEPGVVYNPLWQPTEPVSEPYPLAVRLVAGGIGRKP